MRDFLNRFPDLTDRPIPGGGRILLVAGAVLLAVAIFLPLWQIHLEAPQYPEGGLDMYIYSHKLDAGNDGQDLKEINNLNHYFLLGGFALLSLRAAFFGTVGAAIDTLVLFVYFGAFSLWRFYYQLYTYAHNLDPKAAMDIEPFTPILIGWKQIANFTQYSFPREGSILLLGAVVCFGTAIWMGVRSGRETAAPDADERSDAEAMSA